MVHKGVGVTPSGKQRCIIYSRTRATVSALGVDVTKHKQGSRHDVRHWPGPRESNKDRELASREFPTSIKD